MRVTHAREPNTEQGVVESRPSGNDHVKMARGFLSNAELRECSREHLAYEVQMFLAAAGFLELRIAAQDDNSGWFLRNAQLEAAVLHGRNLVDFLYPRGSFRPDDLVANHFYPGPSAFPVIDPISPELEKFRARADKEMAHLTTQRLAGTPPEKAYDEVAFIHLVARLRQFAGAADSSKLHPNVSRVLALAAT